MEIKELGHVVLYVSNLERSRHFYGDVLGWNEVKSERRGAAMFTAGRTHHELLLLEVGETAQPIPDGRRVGMYHFGLKIGTTDEELIAAIQQVQEAKVTIVGASDHGVTHSLYIQDPDGNDVELYIDVQPELWRDDPTAVLAPTKALVL
jgi:catechol 2,3-dioxygenase